MAYKDFDGTETYSGAAETSNTIHANGENAIALPDSSYIQDANITRAGLDLTLDGPNGTITIKDYFAGETSPDLVSPDGHILTPDLVNSFASSPTVYAANPTMNDASPVGAVEEFTGEATVTRTDGSVEPISQGTPIYQGDVIETGANGAVNIVFSDETSFAVSEDARLAIDEYVFDPATNEGSQDFSVLKGVFVFTSGLIGREDPDDVNIDTPSGSIGIRGTIIAGDTNSGEITVVEGAIVLRDFAGNEMTLANQFETAKFLNGGGVENMGQMAANDVTVKFAGVSVVAPTLFSSINDAAAEDGTSDAPADNAQDAPANAEGTVDGNNDGAVDGSVETQGGEGESAPEAAPPAADGADAAGQAAAQDQAPTQQPPAPGQMMGTPTGMNNPMMGAPDAAVAAKMGAVSANGGMNPVNASGNAAPAGTAPTAGTATTTAAKAAASVAAEDGTLTPPPPLTPPNVLDPTAGGGTGTNAATHNIQNIGTAVNNGLLDAGQVNIAPDNFFSVGEGQNWSYHFDLEFVDTSGPAANNLTYFLSDASNAFLTGLLGGDLMAFNFNPTTGELGANGLLDLTWNPDTTIGSFTIEVRAVDSVTGEISYSDTSAEGYTSYTYEVVDAAATPGLDTADIVGNAADYIGNASNEVFDLGFTAASTNNRIYAGNGDDTVSLGTNGFLTNTNLVNLGNGENVATLGENTQNNEVIGGFGDDQFIIQGAKNQLFGMDGDDTFEIEMSNTGLMANLQTNGLNILMDGGHSSFSHLDVINGNTPTDFGKGDTLLIQNAGATLDFQNVDDNYIRGIEVIELGAGVQNIVLSYNDIIEMTDHKNTLIFKGDIADSITLAGGEFGVGNFTKSHEDLSVDEGTGTDGNYDVWTDGTVTLLIEQNGGTNDVSVTGLV